MIATAATVALLLDTALALLLLLAAAAASGAVARRGRATRVGGAPLVAPAHGGSERTGAEG